MLLNTEKIPGMISQRCLAKKKSQPRHTEQLMVGGLWGLGGYIGGMGKTCFPPTSPQEKWAVSQNFGFSKKCARKWFDCSGKPSNLGRDLSQYHSKSKNKSNKNPKIVSGPLHPSHSGLSSQTARCSNVGWATTVVAIAISEATQNFTGFATTTATTSWNKARVEWGWWYC